MCNPCSCWPEYSVRRHVLPQRMLSLNAAVYNALFAGIKVALPSECASGRSFLQSYIEYILALQSRSGAEAAGRQLPLAIMTSGDTHDRTLQLLEENNYFGMSKEQVRQ